MTVKAFSPLLLFLLRLLPVLSVSIDSGLTGAGASIPVYPHNVTNIDLSNQGLVGRLLLIFHSEDLTDGAATTTRSPNFDWRQVNIALLNLSGNPQLTSFSVDVASGKRMDGLYIGELDIGGTQLAPLPGRLFQPAQTASSDELLISIRMLTANGTAVSEPLDLTEATDYMYSLRVETFSITGWKLVNENQLPASITSHRANSCASKRFNSIYVTGLVSRDGVDLVGVAGSSSQLAVSDTIDFSDNRLRTLANVTFNARRTDLSGNRLVDLPNVFFRPGSVCRAVVTGSPTLLLRRNQLSPKALDRLAGQRFSGLDLAENSNLLKASESETLSQIYVSEFSTCPDCGAVTPSCQHC
ncbi:hypothetical protein BOX15_Mlig028986g2 [Macrostomum lignano]|uniref:Uncharacterized protein n=1 Tax=Macrostomum lignano TaxID=282301 RepID=A0A267E8L1_9PLAT|nr:hypothetical protein BOX15_Mlig028986g2 [Macrostomum lignano]